MEDIGIIILLSSAAADTIANASSRVKQTSNCPFSTRTRLTYTGKLLLLLLLVDLLLIGDFEVLNFAFRVAVVVVVVVVVVPLVVVVVVAVVVDSFWMLHFLRNRATRLAVTDVLSCRGNRNMANTMLHLPLPFE
jgi:hypothetical protein